MVVLFDVTDITQQFRVSSGTATASTVRESLRRAREGRHADQGFTDLDNCLADAAAVAE